MTGLAVSRLVLSFQWRRVGIVAERGADIIWLLTVNGLHYAMERLNITVASSSTVRRGGDLEETLLSTARVSRSKLVLVTYT